MSITAARFAAFAAACSLVGCSLVGTPTATPLPPTATQPPPPTATAPGTAPPPAAPEPTATTAPSPTSAPTDTPAAASTPDPNLGVGEEVLYADRFDGKSGWNWTFVDDAVDFGATDGQLNVFSKRAGAGWRFVIRTDVVAADAQVRITARTARCAPQDEYGLVFRGSFDAAEQINAYVFKLSCAGSARFERLQGVDTFVVSDFVESPAIAAGEPAQNELMVWMAKDQFHFYANWQYLFSARDSTLGEGFFGFYIRDVASGAVALSFHDLMVRAVSLP